MNIKAVFWFVLAFLFYSAIIHEVTHLGVGLLFGYKFVSIHFGVPWSYVIMSNYNFWVYLSGGLVNAVGLLCIYKWGRQYFSSREQFLIFWVMLFEFGYSLFEGFIYPHL